MQSKDKQAQHPHLFWDFKGYGGQLAVRQGNWKAIKRNLVKNPKAELELYNLENDPGEQEDLAKAHPDIANALEKIMRDDRSRPAVETFVFGEYGS